MANRNIVILTDRQLKNVLIGLGMLVEELGAIEMRTRSAIQTRDAVKRQRDKGLNQSELTFAMRDIVRLSRKAAARLEPR